jgi:uncharacterized protein (UPF0332 family)
VHSKESIDLSKHRVARAKESVFAAETLLGAEAPLDSINRSYYAIFYSIRAVLALDEVDFKKHSAVISYFQREYVKTEKFGVYVSDYIKDAFSKRQATDYRDFYIVSKAEAAEQLEHAREILEAVTAYLSPLWSVSLR